MFAHNFPIILQGITNSKTNKLPFIHDGFNIIVFCPFIS